MRLERVAITIIALCALSAASPADVLTGPITNPANGHEYYLLNPSTWTSAESQAVSLGGHLATINDADENSWVYNTFTSNGTISRGLWIGLYDENLDQHWQWASGEPVTFTTWGYREPNGDGDYVHVFWPGDGREPNWNDAPDNYYADAGRPINGVVEVVPEPATLSLLALSGVAMLRRRK